jgi:hypothetical protein
MMDTTQFIKKFILPVCTLAVVACSGSEANTESAVQEPEPQPYSQDGEASYYARSLKG